MNTAQYWHWQGYIKDILHDPTNKKYYMLYGQQHNNIADHLISYDVATDAWHRIATRETTINTITRQYEMWQLATDDFQNFYILATVHLTEGDDDTLVRGTYDALESTTSHIKILKYDSTTDTWTTVDDITGNAPQLGFYYSAFAPPTDTITRYPMLPDTRHTFTIATINTHPELIYRGKNGIHTYRLSDGTKRTRKTIPQDSRRAMDCHIGNTPETTFYAWIEQNAGNSVLRIDDGNGTEIVNEAYSNANNPLYKASAHPATGDRTSQIITISDMIHHADELYAVLQIKAGNPTDIHAESEGYLINIKTTSANISPIKHYQHFTRAARSPVIHNGEVYYFEGSHYQYQPHAANVTRTRTLQIDPSEPYPDDTGNLIRMDGDEHIDFGLCWRSATSNPATSNPDNPSGYGRHGGTASPMISDQFGVQLVAGYGDLTKLNEPPVNDINNWHWIQFGKRIPQRIPIFHTNDKQAWERLNTLAKLTNATISHSNAKFSFLPRRTRQTTLISDITDTTSSLIVQDASRFENNGTVLINDELIKYNFLGSNELSDLERGTEGSTPAPHKKGDTVLFVDALACNHADKKNIASLNFKPDFLGIHNQLTARLTPITAHKAEVYLEHKDSIDRNGEKPREFNFDLLTWHERPWAETLLKSYLTDMHQAQHEINITMPWAPHLKLGQTLVVDQQLVAHLRYTPVRILRISHDFDTRKTHITARTFTRENATPKPPIFTNKPADQTFIINEQIPPVLLPKAVGEIIPITYSLNSNTPVPSLPEGITFTDSSCELTGTPTTLGTTMMEYTARDTATPPQTASTRFRITVVNPITFNKTVPRDVIFNEGDEINYPLPTASDGIPSITYEIAGLPPNISFSNCRSGRGTKPDMTDENNNKGRAQRPDPTTRIIGTIPAGQWCIEYRAKDAKNNTITQEFDLHGDSTPQWTSFYITEAEEGRIDNASNQVRLYDSNGNRIRATTGSFNINLGHGDWRGTEITDTHKIFVDNAGNVKIYDLNNTEQPSAHFKLGTGNWQDVCCIGTDKIGFLDRDAAAVRMSDLSLTRIPSADIEFGICANYRSITNDGDILYVLIENLTTVLSWSISDAEFKPVNTIDLMVAGTPRVPSTIRIQPTGTITTL